MKLVRDLVTSANILHAAKRYTTDQDALIEDVLKRESPTAANHFFIYNIVSMMIN